MHISSTIHRERQARPRLFISAISSQVSITEICRASLCALNEQTARGGREEERVSEEEGIEKLRPGTGGTPPRSAYLETIQNSRVREYLTGSLIALLLHRRVKIRITTTRRVIN